MQYLAVLGRQPKISLTELESLFSDVKPLGSDLATFTSSQKPDLARLGGSVKLAEEITERPEKFLQNLNHPGKLTIGLSDYSKKTNLRKVKSEALHLKKYLKNQGLSVRIVENKTPALSSATVFHNQLGEKPGHIELIKYGNRYFSTFGVQNINAYRARDRERPARDAKVGMLPPKLAQILINLCGPLKPSARILDPFCGTGVVLQEAYLMGYSVYGTDADARMVEYSKKNLAWLAEKCKANSFFSDSGAKASAFATGNATDFTWEQPIDAVVFEGYLGPPMSAPPADIKRKSVMQDLIPLYYHTLRNLSSQIAKGTPVVMAIPAFLRPDGNYERLNILDEVEKMGYNVVKYTNASQKDLLYARAGQVVAREIIVLRKK